MRWKYRLSDFWWWFRHRLDPRHRYHIAHTSLKPEYYDPCERIRAVIFEENYRYIREIQKRYGTVFNTELDRELEDRIGYDYPELIISEKRLRDESNRGYQALKDAADWWETRRGSTSAFWDEEASTAEHLCNILEHLDYLGY